MIGLIRVWCLSFIFALNSEQKHIEVIRFGFAFILALLALAFILCIELNQIFRG
jgi:hypothetical protein